MFGKKHQQRVRHQRLMRAASILLADCFARTAAPADLVALAFGRYQMEITEDEAARYLNAAQVQRGERLPRPADVEELPAPDADDEPVSLAKDTDVEAAPAS
ncbi:hypothetical protein ACIF6H_32230 [Streptomyces microflavus]|uniref:hypothetical protein n=1 Tax=Streptomyces microflavus TaxID=1919 RepID=UPI0037D7ED08